VLTPVTETIALGGFMEASLMGKVLVSAKIENLSDLHHVETGSLGPERVRTIEVSETLVDTGATALAMPKRLIDQLGLRPPRRRRALTTDGEREVQVYGTVRLTVQGRECVAEVSEVADKCPVLIGQVPLELMDFVVDPAGQRLIGNPAHGGEQMIELY
jgi:predicted aspartyl protease